MAKVLSMEIGRLTTKIVEMDFQKKKPKVYRCFEIKTPEDAVRDGYINPLKAESLTNAIKKVITDNKIRTKRVLFTVFSGKIISREILLPAVKVHQIGAVINANITDYFPIELTDYKVSYFHIKTFKEGESAGKHKVLVVAAEKELLESYDKLASDLGMHIVDIDYMGNSIHQASCHSAGAEGIAVIKIEEENTVITIMKQETLILQRTVNYGFGLPQEREESDNQELNSLVGTLLRIFDFYMSQSEENTLETVYFIGDGSKQEGIIELIHDQLQLPCRVLDKVRGVAVQKKAEDADMNVFAAAIGAGITSIGFANEKEKERHETNYLNACVLMVLLCIVLVVTVLAMALIPYNAAVFERNSLAKKEEQYSPAKAVHDIYMGTQDLYNQVNYGNMLTQNSNDAILDFLGELEIKLPSDVEVTEFSSNAEQCVITMHVADKEIAAGVIDTMRGFKSLRSVGVESITEDSVLEGSETELNSDNTIISFTLTCDYLITPVEEPVMNYTEPEQTDETAETAQTSTAE